MTGLFSLGLRGEYVGRAYRASRDEEKEEQEEVER